MNDSSKPFPGRFRRRPSSAPVSSARYPDRLLLEDLEPRLLYSAAPVEMSASPGTEVAGAEAIEVATPVLRDGILPSRSGSWDSGPPLEPSAPLRSAAPSLEDGVALSSWELAVFPPGEIASLDGGRVRLSGQTPGTGPEWSAILVHEAAHLADSLRADSALSPFSRSAPDRA